MGARFFASDNASGAHPEILEALAAANRGHVLAYGDDPYTERAAAVVRRHFGEQARVYFVFGGTGANVLALRSVMQPYHAAVCAHSAHLWCDECAAPEVVGGFKLVPVESDAGKLDPDRVRGHLVGSGSVHGAQPRVLSVAQATEMGTTYRPQELRALAELAHAHDVLLHVDGARLYNAAAFLDVSLRELTTDAGVDVLSLGGTKNGLLGAEAVVFLRPGLDDGAGYLRKQGGQLASKMRFVAVQLEALLAGDLWRESAAHANRMAQRLAIGAVAIDGVTLVAPVEANGVFARLPQAAIEPLREKVTFHRWDPPGVVRWMCSFDTTEEDVDDLVALVRAEVDGAR